MTSLPEKELFKAILVSFKLKHKLLFFIIAENYTYVNITKKKTSKLTSCKKSDKDFISKK